MPRFKALFIRHALVAGRGSKRRHNMKISVAPRHSTVRGKHVQKEDELRSLNMHECIPRCTMHTDDFNTALDHRSSSEDVFSRVPHSSPETGKQDNLTKGVGSI